MILDSQVAVLPSFYEGLPIFVLEALSYGLPVNATDVGDMSMAVIDGATGYLIQPGDVKQLEKQLEIINHKDIFLKMSESARKLAERMFSDEKFFRAIAECYLNLVK